MGVAMHYNVVSRTYYLSRDPIKVALQTDTLLDLLDMYTCPLHAQVIYKSMPIE